MNSIRINLLLASSLILNLNLLALGDTIRPKSRVSEVTVFFNGAQVSRSLDFRTSAGSKLLLVEGLPEEINPQSVQIASVPGCRILSVKQMKEQSNIFAPAQEKEINARIKAQELKIKAIKNKQNVYEIEERLLLDNSNISKKDEGATIANIKAAADLYRLRMNEIKQAKLDLSVELDAAEEQIKELFEQMNQKVSKQRLPSSRFLISLDCEREAEVQMKLSYYVTSAGWEPLYDFRMEDLTKAFQVVYNANVFQSSGEHWENAKLRLSTVDPSLSANKPQLNPWILGAPVYRPMQAPRGLSGSIEGTLADAATQQFIANANVLLYSGEKLIGSAITDAKGKFNFKPVPAGSLMLHISYVGYQNISQQISVNPGYATAQNFYMQASSIAMREQPLPTFQQPKFVPQENYYDGNRAAMGAPSYAYEEQVMNAPARMDQVQISGKVKSRRQKESQALQEVEVIQENSPIDFDNLFSTLNENLSDIEYEIRTPYTVRSDGQDHVIRIKDSNVPARFVYHAVPKLESDVFLVAELVNWQQLRLLSGKVSVYVEGTFTGQTYINADLPGDTLEISLGRDKDIVVKREGNKMLNDKKTIGNNVKETFAWDISIKNNKKSAINLVLEDQYPISQRKSVEVELLESSGAKVDKNSGKLSWELNIEPGAKKTIATKFSVKYPKQTVVVNE